MLVECVNSGLSYVTVGQTYKVVDVKFFSGYGNLVDYIIEVKIVDNDGDLLWYPINAWDFKFKIIGGR